MDKDKLASIIVLLSFIIDIVILYANFIASIKLILIIVSIITTSYLVTKIKRIKLYYGIAYLVGTKKGINLISRLATNYKRLFELIANLGLVMGFGLISSKLVKEKKFLFLGILVILASEIFILPFIGVGLNFIYLPQITTKVSASTYQGIDLLPIISILISIIGGFSAYILFLLLYSDFNLFFVLLFEPRYITNEPPGIAPLIPGITLPLSSGIAAIALLLLAHEFSHGILAKIKKNNPSKIGIILAGWIPLGAFVKIDDKKLKKMKVKDKVDIAIAGVATNFILFIVFGLITYLFVTMILPTTPFEYASIYALKNSPASAVIQNGSKLISWNGVNISNLEELYSIKEIPNSIVTLVTNNGTYRIESNSSGKIGVIIIPRYSGLFNFIYGFIALSFMLNFFVALVNLLPLPGLDGWYIYDSLTKNKKIKEFLIWITFLSFLIQALPWLWSF